MYTRFAKFQLGRGPLILLERKSLDVHDQESTKCKQQAVPYMYAREVRFQTGRGPDIRFPLKFLRAVRNR